MIAHISIPVTKPKETALFFAAVIDGLVFNFPVVPGAWIAVANDQSGLAIEVYPINMAHHPGVGEVDPAVQPAGPITLPWEDQIHPEADQTQPTGFHAALTTKLAETEVIARAKAMGWRALVCERGGVFGLVEVWIDNNFLVEVLAPAEVARYRAFMTAEGCRQMFGTGLSPEPLPQSS
ncbi:MAG TPA: hypothetical protein PLD20_16490 [Blastocatellia bacterium]|nr:hypothetical protein [Blastocatellia bacterium]HMZ19537.1 hypothetical protein [Blastocatellia bacterium]